MAYMYFSPEKTAGIDEAMEGLYSAAQQTNPSIEFETLEDYPGEGTIEAAGTPESLDALPPDVLDALIRDSISEYLDHDAYHEAMETERAERERLAELARTWAD